MIIHNPQLSANKIIQAFGLKKALETMNLRELRNLFKNKSSRLIQLNKVNLPIKESSLADIRSCINEFKAIRPSSLFF